MVKEYRQTEIELEDEKLVFYTGLKMETKHVDLIINYITFLQCENHTDGQYITELKKEVAELSQRLKENDG